LSTVALAAGRYRLERRLGEGGMASVYLARDEELDRPVAIKLLADNLAGDEAFRERFLREARIAAGLAHANVVAVFDAGEEDGRPYIVMEYVDGETLADSLARAGGRLAPGRAVDLALQACAGLEHAHAAGLVHRDVKPHNLLLRTDGVLKVADFGIVRAAEATRMTEIGTVLGTAAYLAPEAAKGEDATAAADIYALGAVLYELLTGRPPRAFGSLAELALPRAPEPIRPVRELAPAVPERIEAAVMRALEHEPERRPASVAELASMLTVASPDPPTLSQPVAAATTRLRRAPAPHRGGLRRGRLLAVGAAAVLGLLALAGALARGGDSPPPRPAVRIGPVAPGATPEEGAGNLAEWIRAHSR